MNAVRTIEVLMTERAAWAAITDAEAKRISRAGVQHLADSEPGDDTIEAQELLRGSPQEGLFCISGDELEQAIYTVIANATYDAPHFTAGSPSDIGEALNAIAPISYLRHNSSGGNCDCFHCRGFREGALRIESLFNSLRSENEALRSECSGWQDIAESNQKAYESMLPHNAEGEIGVGVETCPDPLTLLAAENSRLRELSLSKEEARLILNGVPWGAFELDPVRAKLRLLSGQSP